MLRDDISPTPKKIHSATEEYPPFAADPNGRTQENTPHWSGSPTRGGNYRLKKKGKYTTVYTALDTWVLLVTNKASEAYEAGRGNAKQCNCCKRENIILFDNIMISMYSV